MKQMYKRVLCLVLVLALLAGTAAPAASAAGWIPQAADQLSLTQVSNSAVSVPTEGMEVQPDAAPDHADTDIVRVSILLEGDSAVAAGFSPMTAALDPRAAAYREALGLRQEQTAASIEGAIGRKLDVVWNLTLSANLISANVAYGDIAAIAAVPGVAGVLIENRYDPAVVDRQTAADPMMSTSSSQIGSAAVWAAGYTGAGSRIAVIDTGADTDHQSLDPVAFRYSLAYQAGQSGMSSEEYLSSIDLLDADEIASVAPSLNAGVGAEAYVNAKIPFGYNYVDAGLDITHDNDTQGSHGSHVAGIAAANAYLNTGDGFVRAIDACRVQGVAPDAQIIVMKVFGTNGGAYESDIMAAIEDALVLGCDAVNLSLGSTSAGASRSSSQFYQQLMDGLTETGAVISCSAGNNSYWGAHAFNLGYLYAEDASLDTVGNPGSYTNSLTVASVENDGLTSKYIRVGDDVIFYTETLFNSQKPLTYIAGEQSYVMIDGFGTAEDWAATGVSLAGKVAICSRGDISFAEKAQIAIGQGAKALIVYNNQAGVFGMDLTDYIYTWPCVSITQADGDSIRAKSVPVTDDDGNILYYSGTLTVSTDVVSEQYNSDFYTMSDFSSWGVPGSLELKPEITAPGGNIYSLNGIDTTGTGYETMSGTSMAAPQIAGMTALIAEYIREHDLEAVTGLTARQLTQSLLMSTAVPLIEEASGSYYPVLQQGAGLANVADVIAADSYVLMGEDMNAGAADGKIKVELGDDPTREGVYEMSFTLHNLSDREQTFRLSGEFFTQSYFQDHNVNMGTVLEGMYNYMDTSTMPMSALTAWAVDGVALQAGLELDGMDFNGDGQVNTLDGQTLLDYVVGTVGSISSPDKADLDADGDVDTHDAYLFFRSLGTAHALVPAGSSVEVTVTLELTDDWDQLIETWGTNGLYIEGYLFARELTDEEGTAGTCHSIPVLGWYGNWSDPPMYDMDFIPFSVTKEDTQCPYVGFGTDFTITYGSDATSYYFAGHPLGMDSVYKPERNAINAVNGTMIKSFRTNLIRIAASMRFTAVNETTGELLLERIYGSKNATYYDPTPGGWDIDLYNPEVYFKPRNVSEGDVLLLNMAMAPEYYVDAEGNTDWDALGEGAHFGLRVTVDNTAPVLEQASLDPETGILTVRARDNNYVAAVSLIDGSGSTLLASAGSMEDIAPDTAADFELDVSGITGSSFFIQTIDYARNASTYYVTYGEGGESAPLHQMMAFSSTDKNWQGFTPTSAAADLEPILTPGVTFHAATIADHMVIAVTDTGDLYVMDEGNLGFGVQVANLGILLTDMAYNSADGLIYGVSETGELFTIDHMTAEVISVGQIGISTNTLACDAAGTFYCNKLGSNQIYRFTLDTMDAPELLVTTNSGNSAGVQAMEIDPNDGKLYWLSACPGKAGFGFSAKNVTNTYLYEIDPAAATYVRLGNLNGAGLLNITFEQFSCLLIPANDGGSCQWPEGTDVISSIRFPADEITIYKTTVGKDQLSASALPWNLVDPQLVYSSSDESIVRVDANGVLTGLKEGTATVTASAAGDPSIFDECLVHVVALDVTIEGTVKTAPGESSFFSWDMKTQDTWSSGASIGMEVKSATRSTLEDVWYMSDSVSGSWAVHKVAADGTIVESGLSDGLKLPLWDLAYAPYLSERNGQELVAGIYEDFFLMPQDPMTTNFNRSVSRVETDKRLVALASGGHYELVLSSSNPFQKPSVLNTERYVLLDNAGSVTFHYLLGTDKGLTATCKTDLALTFPGFDNMADMFCSMVFGDDGNLYLSAFTGSTTELYRMIYDEAANFYHAEYIGTMGDGVYPATLTAVTSNAPAEAAASPTRDLVPFEAESLSVTEILASAAEPNSAAEPGSCLDSFTVTITAAEAATNGLTTVTYDDSLILEQVSVMGEYTSVLEEKGAVTFGYVSLNGIPADAAVAVLTFRSTDGSDTSVTADHRQLNNAAGREEQLPVQLRHDNTELRNAKAPTCTAEGYTGDLYCLDCGRCLESGTVLEATGHHFGEWEQVCAPDCFHDGLERRLCGCGYAEERPLDATSENCPGAGYTDLEPNAWYHEGVDHALRSGWMIGRSETVFAPYDTMNRAELVTVLHRIAGSPDPAGAENPFTDVPEDAWFTDAVVWAFQEGIINGVSADRFAPAQVLTREQIAVILYRAMKAEPLAEDHLSAFVDSDQISGYALDAMNWAVGTGILNGMPGRILAPQGSADRASVAVIFYRYFN